jgi:hypothetical protein
MKKVDKQEVKFGSLKEGQLFKRSELDSHYFIRGKYLPAVKRFNCKAFRCKDHERFSWADCALQKTDVVHKYVPEEDTRQYAL